MVNFNKILSNISSKIPDLVQFFMGVSFLGLKHTLAKDYFDPNIYRILFSTKIYNI